MRITKTVLEVVSDGALVVLFKNGTGCLFEGMPTTIANQSLDLPDLRQAISDPIPKDKKIGSGYH